MKGPRGYGFSVSTETSPVMITSVQEGECTTEPSPLLFSTTCSIISINCAGLTAHQQDLRAGDLIIEVENTDVTRANSDMIVNMIKYASASHPLLNKQHCPLLPLV